MDLIQESSTYQAISVIVPTKEYRYIIFNMHLMFTFDSYLSKYLYLLFLVLFKFEEFGILSININVVEI